MGSRIVFGYHPYWASAAWRDYRYDVLTHVAHFSAEVDPASGEIVEDRGWSSTGLVPKAQSAGVKVILACSNIGAAANTTLLAQRARCATLIEHLGAMVRARGASGVNIDFEQVSAAQRGNLARFASDLAQGFRAQLPGAEISFSIPAIDWSKSYDVQALSAVCDYLILMGYDYSWKGSKNAGAVAPLEGPASLAKSVETYLAAGVPAGKLVVAVPYYGYDWPVQSNVPQADCIGPGSAVVYHAAKAAAAAHGRQFDAASASPYYSYRSGDSWRQAWYEDAESLAAKYALINNRNLGGAGIWALSYDGECPELWDALRAAFAVPRPAT
jgi:spore germination protein YaaH